MVLSNLRNQLYFEFQVKEVHLQVKKFLNKLKCSHFSYGTVPYYGSQVLNVRFSPSYIHNTQYTGQGFKYLQVTAFLPCEYRILSFEKQLI